MARGLQVFNAAGGVIFDTNDRLTRMIGSMLISGAGSITVPEFAQGGGFYFAFPQRDFNGLITGYPVIDISGTTLSWSTPGTPQLDLLVYYGVY